MSKEGKYVVILTLTTDTGELPNKEEAEDLIVAQMSGELDDTTGLACMAVEVLSEAIHA